MQIWKTMGNAIDYRTLYGLFLTVWNDTHTVTFESTAAVRQQARKWRKGPMPPNLKPHKERLCFWRLVLGQRTVHCLDLGSDTVNGDITLYAKWVLVLHTVTFDSTAASTVASQDVEEGAYAAEPEVPARSGHAFDGWYSDISLSNTWTFGSDTVNGDITLYAKWRMLEGIFVQGGTFQMGSTGSEAIRMNRRCTA